MSESSMKSKNRSIEFSQKASSSSDIDDPTKNPYDALPKRIKLN
jgi:hypothetical protein